MYRFIFCLVLMAVSCMMESWSYNRHPELLADPEELIFAEILTPNGDGNNDFFVIKNLHEFPINKIHIFNRWGDKVYQAEPYKNDWDGISNAENQLFGSRVPDGTYFYRFEYLIGDFTVYRNGKVILIR